MEPAIWGMSEGGRYLRGAHDGFHPVRHARTVYDVGGRCFVVADSLSGPDSFSAESYIHFYAGLEVEEVGSCWRVHGDGVDFGVMPFGVEGATVICGAESPQQGWYCPEFGSAIAAPVLCLRAAAATEVCFGYALFSEYASVPTRDEFSAMLEALDPVPPGLSL